MSEAMICPVKMSAGSEIQTGCDVIHEKVLFGSPDDGPCRSFWKKGLLDVSVSGRGRSLIHQALEEMQLSL